MRIRTAPSPVDPQEIFTIHGQRESGLSPGQIGLLHELSPATVQRLLRSRPNTTFPTPFELTKAAFSPTVAISIYWLGFITACGRVSQGTVSHTLVLSLDACDLDFGRTLAHDLIRTYGSCEFCLSSRDGHQMYIRDRDLGDAVAHWGLMNDPRETRLPLGYISDALLPHFVRGLLEGQIYHPPFGGRHARTPTAGLSRITIPGSPLFIGMLQDRVQAGAFSSDGRDGLRRLPEGEVNGSSPETALLTYQGPAARKVLRYAYRTPIRSSPRAERLVKAFASP